MAISKSDFDFISQLARNEAAIVLEPGKEYLVEARLGTLAQKEGFDSIECLINRLRGEKFNTLHNKTIDSLTTNETSFFRDFHPFEALRKQVIPQIIAARSATRQLSIWSAACSTGQEPYTLAMMLAEHFPELIGWRIVISATDLSPTVLKAAAEASYSQFEVNRGLPASYLIKYFTKRDDRWYIKDEIKKMVVFRQMNLIQPWPIMQPHDLVFMRNVMIYFDVETKKMLLKRIRNCLMPHGYLILGSAETTLNIDASFSPVSIEKTVFYAASK